MGIAESSISYDDYRRRTVIEQFFILVIIHCKLP